MSHLNPQKLHVKFAEGIAEGALRSQTGIPFSDVRDALGKIVCPQSDRGPEDHQSPQTLCHAETLYHGRIVLGREEFPAGAI